MRSRFLSRRSLFVAAVVAVGASSLTTAPAWAISGERAVALTKVLMANCSTVMKARRSASGLPEASINGYCSCTATETVKELTDDEYSLYLKTEGRGTVAMRDRNARIVRLCTKKYLH